MADVEVGRRERASLGSHARFLDAAEELFALRGYDGTKIRAIAERSEVNLGALHRYWGTKKALFREVCERRLRPVNEARHRRLDELISRTAKGRPVDVKELLHAMLNPVFFAGAKDETERALFQKFYGRVLLDPAPEVGEVMTAVLEPTSKRFLALLREACPRFDDNQFYWRVVCVFGVFIYAPAFSDRILHHAGDRFASHDYAFGVEQIVEFLAAGMQAPA